MISGALIKPITTIVNICIQQRIFPDRMKLANITPLYKKKDKLNKTTTSVGHRSKASPVCTVYNTIIQEIKCTYTDHDTLIHILKCT